MWVLESYRPLPRAPEVRRSVLGAAVATLVAALVACGPSPSGRGGTAAPRPTTPADAPTPTPAPEPTFAPVRPFSAARAMRHVRVLAGRIGPRPGGSGAYHRAARYVETELAEEGWRVEVERFALPRGGRSANVIATWGARGGRSVVLGAHLDTVERSPGANDNASGVAVLLEAARELSGSRYAPDVTFVAFGAEERQPEGSHHLGSAHFVEELRRRELQRIRAMLSIDMVGTNAPVVVGTLDDDLGATPLVVRAARRTDVHVVRDVVGDVSDHGPFSLAGVPAVLLWTGLEPSYHSPGDVVARVDLAALRNAGRLVIGVVRAALRP